MAIKMGIIICPSLEDVLFFRILGMPSSQVTLMFIFQRGRCTTNQEKMKSGFTRNFFRRTTFVVVDEADSLMVKVERDGEKHTSEILKSLRSDIQMLYRGSITILRWICQEATARKIEGSS